MKWTEKSLSPYHFGDSKQASKYNFHSFRAIQDSILFTHLEIEENDDDAWVSKLN